MPELSQRLLYNAQGRFYVDESCIDCDACRQHAPHNFRRNEEEGTSYVFKQPVGESELSQCKNAMEECPVEAIGDTESAPALR